VPEWAASAQQDPELPPSPSSGSHQVSGYDRVIGTPQAGALRQTSGGAGLVRAVSATPDLDAWSLVENPPHRRGADPVAEAEQFALDPLVAPAGFSRAICSMSAASTARSAQSSLGLGCWRRSTATSWRSTRSSASFDADERASSTIHPASWTKIR
jgi:hypothetical protein